MSPHRLYGCQVVHNAPCLCMPRPLQCFAPTVQPCLCMPRPLQCFECMTTLTGHTGEVRGVAISADGDHIVTGSADGTVRWVSQLRVYWSR